MFTQTHAHFDAAAELFRTKVYTQRDTSALQSCNRYMYKRVHVDVQGVDFD